MSYQKSNIATIAMIIIIIIKTICNQQLIKIKSDWTNIYFLCCIACKSETSDRGK